MFRKVLTGIDGSEHAWRALDVAGGLAQLCGAQLLIVHVVHRQAQPDVVEWLAKVEHMPIEEEQARFAADTAMGDALTREAIDRLARYAIEGVSCHVAEGHPARVIAQLANEETVDLVVLGSRGLGDARSLLLGSVSHKVSHLAACPCLLVP